MRYGLSVPCFGEEPRFFGELAREVEGAGWDGLFLWDHIRWRSHYHGPILDPWVLLSVAAMTRIEFGSEP